MAQDIETAEPPTESAPATPRPVPCPRCGNNLREGLVRTAIWKQDRLFVVEDIPAHVCDFCVDQYYGDDVTDALRRLTQDDLGDAEPTRIESVPVYSLEGRLPPPRPDNEPIEMY